jgi:hypothetical protein
VTAPIAPATSAALRIGGKANATAGQDPVEAQPQCRRVASQRQLDGLAGQRLGIARE